MLTFFAVLELISLIAFIWIMFSEPRGLISGFSLIWLLFTTLFFLLFLMFRYSEHLARSPVIMSILVILAVIAAVLILFFPVSLIAFFIIEGLKNIRHEGFRFSNLLSLGFGIFLILYLFSWPFLRGIYQNRFLAFVFMIISISVGYFLFILSVYCLSAWLNTLHPFRKKNIDEIVVLGSGILGCEITPLLKSRVDRGISLLRDQKDARLILSGGQGPGEDIPESQAMAAYAISQGVDPSLIVMERKSRNTDENLKFSRELFRETSKNVAVVTTGYHVFRALILARKIGIPCRGYGSKTKWYFAINAILREYIGYLSLTWKKHALILCCILAPFVLFYLIRILF